MKSNHKSHESINKPTHAVTGGGIWLYLANLLPHLSQTHTLNPKNPLYFCLDCYDLPLANLAMTNKERKSMIRFAMTNKTHPLTPSAREGETAELPHARDGEFFTSLTSLKGTKMIT